MHSFAPATTPSRASPHSSADREARQRELADLIERAAEHGRAGRPAEAELILRQVVARDPDCAAGWAKLAITLLGQRQFEGARDAAHRALGLRGDLAEAHTALIGARDALGDGGGALTALVKAVEALPHHDKLRFALALRLEAIGRFEEAAALHFDTIERHPSDATAHFHLGRMLASSGRPEAALAAYGKAAVLKPDFGEVFSNLGTLLSSVGRFRDAAAAGLRARELLPDSPEVALNLGVALQQGGDVGGAVAAYEAALALDPETASAHANLGVAYQELFRFDDAVRSFERALAIRPAFDTAAVELIKLRRHICDWSRHDEDQRLLLAMLEEKRDVIFMLLLMGFESSPQQQFDSARFHMRHLNAVPRREHPAPPAGCGDRIRIGYLSADYRDHPVGRLLPELFERHDRSRFEITAYALGTDDPGALRRRIAASCDRFVNLHPVSNADAAKRIEADGIDILIDLTGATIGSRLDILAARPAPVQVSYLGWPGTMGADFLDYVIGDDYLTPPGQEAFYTEKIVRLPDCYQPSDTRRQPSPLPIGRAACGLPDDAFVFCSFNNTTKLTPAVFDLWMRLLRRVENGVLWIYCKTPRTIDNLRARAAAAGVEAHRLVFASVAAYDVYLSRLALADVFLDSFPYNAGATCSDALFMGLPVLTLSGETYVSRMAGSLLKAAGLPELVTTSLADYEEEAVRLATEPGRLADRRRRLAEARGTAPLFDMGRTVRHLEWAYARMHDLRREGRPPEAFAVPAESETPPAPAVIVPDPLPRLSVVIATHHRPALLARAIASVKAQARRDVEIIVVADEGTPETGLAALAALGAEDTFLRRNGPPGPARSRNLAVSLARGAYVMFLDDDDRLSPGLFDVLAGRLDALPDGIHFWDYDYVVEDRSGTEGIVERLRRSTSLADVDRHALFVKNRIPNHVMAVPRHAAARLAFDERLRSLEDWDFLLGLLHAGLPLSHLPFTGSEWCRDLGVAHRNPMSDAGLVPDYLSVYRKWPAPDAATRSLRREMLRAGGFDAPASWF